MKGCMKKSDLNCLCLIILSGLLLFLSGCDVLLSWDNPVDPDGESYRGYPSYLDPDDILLLSPIVGREVLVLPELSWSEIIGADNYHCRLSLNEDFTSVVWDQQDLTEKSIPFPTSFTPQADTDYYWQVRALLNGVWGEWSPAQSFSITPLTDQDIEPVHGAILSESLPLLNWSNAGNSFTYELQMAGSASEVPGITPVAVTDGSQYQLADELALDETLCWRYRVLDEEGAFSFWSSIFSFSLVVEVGDTYSGGIVFYLDGVGGGLAAAGSDQNGGNEVQWGGYNTTVNNTYTEINTGQANTDRIVSILGSQSESYAAEICSELVLNGYDDWFLPSRDELYEMYEVLHEAGWGDFRRDGYWSSTEGSSSIAVYISFYNGYQGFDYKYRVHYVRAIRSF